MAIRLGPILDVAVAVNDALSKEAAKPHISLEPADVPKVEPRVTAEVSKTVQEQVKPVVDVLTNQEPFYKSVQWWVAMLGLVGTVLGLFNVTFDAEMQKQVLAIIMSLIGVVTAIGMFYNRYIRTSRLLARLGIQKV